MLLWKNLLIVSVAVLFAAAMIMAAGKGHRHHPELIRVSAVCGAVVLALMSPLPYSASMLVLMVAIPAGTNLKVGILTCYFAVVFTAPILELRLAGGLGITTLLIVSVPLLCGLTVLLMWLVAPRRFVRSPVRALDLIVLLFILVLSILSTRGLSPQAVIRVFAENCLTLGGAYVVASRGRLVDPQLILKCMSLVGVFLATVAIFEAVRRWPQFVGVYDAKGLTLNSGMSIRAGFMRSLGPFTDPIAFSIFLAVSALALLGLLEARGGRRAIISACGVLTVCGLGFTFSRTGIVALCAGVAVFALLRRKMLHLVALGGVLGLGAFLFSAIAGVGSSSSAEYRLKLWEAGRDVILQNPIFGNNQAVDQGDLYQLVQGQGIVDLVNSYIQLGIQGGLVLILCFLAIPVAATARYLKHRARLLAESRLLGDVVQAQLAALLAGLAFTSLTDKNLLLVTLLAGLLAGVPANDKVLQKSRAALKHRKDRRPEGLVGAELVAQ